MEIGSVSILSIIGMVFTFLISFGIPIGLAVFIRKRTKADITGFFIGAAAFVVFALVLEQILHMIVQLAAGKIISGNIWLYALYGGLAAGLFEETGRFAAMKIFMKNKLNMPNALMYGAGHGGIEAMLIVGITSINNIIISAMINIGIFQNSLQMLDESIRIQTLEQVSALWTIPAYQFFMGGIERIYAIFLHIALSVLVYMSIKHRKKLYWIIAFAAHALVDFTAVICSAYLNIVFAEIFIGLLTAGVIVLTILICKNNHEAVTTT